MKKIMVAVPTIDGKVVVEFMQSLYEEQLLGIAKKIAIIPEFYSGISDVALARNYLAAKFLQSEHSGYEYDEMVFVDSDQGWEPGAIIRLCEYPVDIVGGAVPVKKLKQEYRVTYLPDDPEKPGLWTTKDGLIEIAGMGTGFLRISRRALKTMINEGKAQPYDSQDMYLKYAWDFFRSGVVNNGGMGVWYGEDTNFCRLARECGLKIFLDPMINFVHVGRYAYEGNIGKFIKGEYKNPAFNAIRQAAKEISERAA